MGQLRSQWQQYKSGMDEAGVKTSIFTMNFGPQLDTFDTARTNYDEQKGKYGPKDPKWVAIKASVKQSGLALEPVFSKYTQTVTYMSEHATDPRQKQPLQSTENWLVHTMSNVIVPAVKAAST